MRIASVLTAALAVGAFGGLAVASIIDTAYHELRDLEEAASRDSVAVAKLQGIRDSTEHVLAVTGTGLQSGNSDLVRGSMQRLKRLSLAIHDLGEIGLVDDAEERLNRFEELVGDIVVEVESRRQLEDVSLAALATYDSMAAELGALIGWLQEDAMARASAARSALLAHGQHRHRSDLVLLSGYSLLMVLVLIGLLRYIAAPVQRLTVRAEDAIDLGHRFRPVNRGPREIKQLGGTIASLVGDLETKVGERTSELADRAIALRAEVDSRRSAEIELRKAIGAAEAASAAKSRFLSAMSHELRTPMNAILGTLSLLRDTELETEQKTYIETAADAGQALMTLLNDVIDMSRMASGGVELAEREFDLVETLDQTLSLFHPACCAKGVVLAGLLAPDVHRYVCGDQPRIRQILTNLVGNAVKFTDHGHIRVRIARSIEDRGKLTFIVEDTGTGIPHEEQSRIFADFAPIDLPEGRQGGGTGLGLAICKGLVDAMGGKMALSSASDAGSEFSFTVQLVPSGRAENTGELEMRQQLKRMHVVIAGSCFALAESLRSILEGWVASVTVATDPVTLSQIISDGAPGNTRIICGPPDRPVWQALLSAFRSSRSPRDMVAIVPCAPDAARLAAEHGDFDVIYDQALKPLTLMKLICGDGFDKQDSVHPETFRDRDARILLVEDSAANRLVASAMLEKAGYTVAIAENGRDALEITMRCCPDLILMDLQMPVMDGYDAFAGIRQMAGRAGQTPVIALSANAMAKSDAKERHIDFDAYLAKPLSRTQLLNTVAETLDRRSSVRNERRMTIAKR